MGFWSNLLGGGGSQPAAAAAPAHSRQPADAMPVVIEHRCVRRRHAASGCNVCAQVCPVGAMHLDGRSLKVDLAECTACGACASACPAEALYIANPGWDATDQAFADAEAAGRLMLRCAHAAKNPVEGPVLTVPCLFGVDVTRVTALAAKGAAEISCISGRCLRCPRSAGRGSLRDDMILLERFLQSLGAKTTVTLSEAPKSVDMSRRRMFGAVLHDKPAAKVADTAPERIKADPELRVPESRKRFLEAIETLTQGDTERLDRLRGQFKLVRAGERPCNGCELCGRVCPTGALKSEKAEDGTLTISVVPRDCTGCGLCADICFPSAIAMHTLETAEEIPAVFERAPQVIVTHKPENTACAVPVYRT